MSPTSLLHLLFIFLFFGGVAPDSTPPYFHPGYPHAATITGSSFELQLKLTKTGVVHYAVVRAETHPNGDGFGGGGGGAAAIPEPSEVGPLYALNPVESTLSL